MTAPYNTKKATDMEKTNTISFIELFAGVGGFRLGLEESKKNNTKYSVKWSNQWEPSTKKQHASEVYSSKFNDNSHSNDDISLVKTEDIPDHDLLVGGFPCQDYSVASTLKNAQGIVGKKGVLWWQIHRILSEKQDKAPRYLMLENVDRLLKSPSKQRGRDFALILSSLNALGYAVEWRIINASDYGMPQRRRRVFIMAYKKDTKLYNRLKKESSLEILNKSGLFAKAFPIQDISTDDILSGGIDTDLVKITNEFNIDTPKKSIFLESGYMINGEFYTIKNKPKYDGKITTLGDILQDDEDVPEHFYISAEELEKWQYQKGSKSIERVNKTTGHKYLYSEGAVAFPDCPSKPARTIITGEGGKSASRFKHVIKINDRYRRLTPVELERANMFPDNHTHHKDVTDTKRAFLMGNALVVGIVTKLADKLSEEL